MMLGFPAAPDDEVDLVTDSPDKTEQATKLVHLSGHKREIFQKPREPHENFVLLMENMDKRLR